MGEGTKFLEIILKNGETFGVKGESINDVSSDIHHRDRWIAFELTNGKNIQIWAGEIACIFEREVLTDSVPW